MSIGCHGGSRLRWRVVKEKRARYREVADGVRWVAMQLIEGYAAHINPHPEGGKDSQV